MRQAVVQMQIFARANEFRFLRLAIQSGIQNGRDLMFERLLQAVLPLALIVMALVAVLMPWGVTP